MNCCEQQDGVDADEVIFSPEQARARGLTGTMIFPRGNLAPEGSVVKATAMDPSWWMRMAFIARKDRRAFS